MKAYGQVPETIPDEDACTSALNLLQMVKEKRIKENKQKKVAFKKRYLDVMQIWYVALSVSLIWYEQNNILIFNEQCLMDFRHKN